MARGTGRGADELKGHEFKTIVYRELSRIGKALSNPTRLELLELLCQSEKSVDHVSRQLGSGIATVSHHLQILKASHLAAERRSGRFILYQASETGRARMEASCTPGGVERHRGARRGREVFRQRSGL